MLVVNYLRKEPSHNHCEVIIMVRWRFWKKKEKERTGLWEAINELDPWKNGESETYGIPEGKLEEEVELEVPVEKFRTDVEVGRALFHDGTERRLIPYGKVVESPKLMGLYREQHPEKLAEAGLESGIEGLPGFPEGLVITFEIDGSEHTVAVGESILPIGAAASSALEDVEEHLPRTKEKLTELLEKKTGRGVKVTGGVIHVPDYGGFLKLSSGVEGEEPYALLPMGEVEGPYALPDDVPKTPEEAINMPIWPSLMPGLLKPYEPGTLLSYMPEAEETEAPDWDDDWPDYDYTECDDDEGPQWPDDYVFVPRSEEAGSQGGRAKKWGGIQYHGFELRATEDKDVYSIRPVGEETVGMVYIPAPRTSGKVYGGKMKHLHEGLKEFVEEREEAGLFTAAGG